MVASNGQKLYFDSKDGKYGYNTDPSRGADTFFPFSSGVDGITYYARAAMSDNGTTGGTVSIVLPVGNYLIAAMGALRYSGVQDARISFDGVANVTQKGDGLFTYEVTTQGTFTASYNNSNTNYHSAVAVMVMKY